MKLKILFTLILLFNIILVKAQNNIEHIYALEKSKVNILININILNDSLKKIDFKISKLKSKDILNQIKDSSIISVAIINAKLKKNPNVMGEIILTLEKEQKVIILDYINDFFGVCVNSVCGYMNENWILKNEKIKEFIRFKIQEKEELNRIDEERKVKKDDKEFAAIESRYEKKYGKQIYQKLKIGYIWIGMNKEMATIALGNPKDINTSIGAWGIHEQWVYNKSYYYFENGKLTSYQN